MRPDICIYHGPGCMDGLVAAWAIWKRWPEAQFIPVQYGTPLRLDPFIDRDVLLVDFSYKLERLIDLASVARTVTILDHHKTAEEDLRPFSVEEIAPLEKLTDGEWAAQHSGYPCQALFDMNKSGAMLAWEYAFPGVSPPLMVRYVQDRDLWKFELPGTREIHAFLSSLNDSFEQIDDAADLISSAQLGQAYTAGLTALRMHDKQVASMVAATKHRRVICGHDVPAANLPPVFASDAGSLMAVGEPFSATFYQTKDGRWSVSLRSAEDGMDVSVLAAQFGGGGHAHAAGFTVDLLESA